MMRWLLVAAVLLLVTAGGAVGTDTWGGDSNIVAGLGDIGWLSAPTVFQKDSTWYLITGNYSGEFSGFNWTGSTWQNDTGIVSGLGDVGGMSSPTVFQKDDTWYLISGEHDGNFYGFNWTGSAWQSDSGIVSGLGKIGNEAYPTVFQKDDTWYLISGQSIGTYRGFNWTGSTWQSDSGIVSGLTTYSESAPTVFQKDSTWYVIIGQHDGHFYGFNWTGSAWQSDSGIVSGLGDVGYHSTPTLFQKDGSWYLISGERYGQFYGYRISTPTPIDLSHTKGVFWVNHTWAVGSGAIVTDSYNVSINGTWHNDTTTTYYNNTLSTYGDWSNITVYGYNTTHGLSTGYVSEDVQLPYPVPAVPTGAGSTWDYYWVNHTWAEGSSYGVWYGETDSYNVSINGTWHNGTTDTHYNNTGLPPHGWSNASIYAFNNTGGINETYIYQHVQISNQNITITNTSDWNDWEGANVYVDYDAVDPDSDTPTFSCNRTDLFTDFDTATGQGNWTSPVAGVYYVDFGVSDGWGSTDNYTMTILASAGPTNLDHTIGNTWVNHTWSPSDGGLITDSYNVSINETWHNGTTDTHYNNTGLPPHGWSNASIYAFNNTGGINETYIYQHVQISNQNITITNTSDWNDWEGANVYVDYDAVDPDSDTPTFSCNRTDLFTDFDTATGQGNWTSPVAGVYYVDFGVSDGWGSTDNYTMTIRKYELSATNLSNDTSRWYVNFTWEPVDEYTTDSYNVSTEGGTNDGWHNTTSTFFKVLFDATFGYGTANISIYAFNNTFGLNSTPITDSVTVSPPPLPKVGVLSSSMTTCTHWDGYYCDFKSTENLVASGYYPYKISTYVSASWDTSCEYCGSTAYKDILDSNRWLATYLYCPNTYVAHDYDVSPGVDGYDVRIRLQCNGYYAVPSSASLHYVAASEYYTVSGNIDCVDEVSLWAYNYDSGEYIIINSQLGGSHYSFTTAYGVNYKISFDGDEYPFLCEGPTTFDYNGCAGGWDTNIVVPMDKQGNIIKNVQISIYDQDEKEFIQKWTLQNEGYVALGGVGYTDHNITVMARTFDGIYRLDTVAPAYGTEENITYTNWTIPLTYNIAIKPIDENNVPIHSVFVGLFEYAVANPQAWWGFDTYWGNVPLTNCSSFSRCDLIAEKEGYIDYDVEGLNWTQKSAMIKNYKHTIVMEKES